MVDQAKKRLTNIGLFKAVEVKRRPGSAQDRVILDVELVEQSTGELSFGAGYSTAEGVIGDVSITERNLMGNGQFLRLQLSGSLERLQVNLASPSRASSTATSRPASTCSTRRSTRRASRASRAAVPVAACASASRSPRSCGCRPTTRSRATRSSTSVRCASLAIQDAEGISYTSMVGTTLTYDLRNEAKNPTKGLWFQAGTDFAGLGGDVQYISLAAEARGYYPITDNITFVGRAIGGYIQGWGGEDVRLIDLFFKGGETVRGFDRAGYGPRDLSTGDALGGSMYLGDDGGSPLPHPVRARRSWHLRRRVRRRRLACGMPVGVRRTLWRAAVTSGQACLADSSTIRSSVGASLMWASPVGPIRMDLAKVLTKEAFDDEQIFRFGAATKF